MIPNMKETTVAIIGGGPIGLYAAKILEKRGIPYLLFEAEDQLGGQLQRLYPEKDVEDLPEFPNEKAKNIILKLAQSIDKSKVLLRSPITQIQEMPNGVYLKSKEEYLAQYVLIATGLGFYKPRLMGLPYEKQCSNIYYSLQNPQEMAQKRVVIFGGGDSALDWAKMLSSLSPFVSLVHRRKEFRGNPKTIEGAKIAIYLPYVPDSIEEKNTRCVSVTIKNVENASKIKLPCDAVLVNYGLVPSPSTFALPYSQEGFGILTNDAQQASERIYAIGDCCFQKDRRKRIKPGFEEADAAIASLCHHLSL